MVNIAELVMDRIDETTNQFVREIYGALSSQVDTAITGMATVIVILYGLFTMVGWIEYPAKEAGKKLFLFTTVYALTTNWPYFQEFFVNAFTNWPDHIAGVMLENGTGGSTTSLGELMTQSFEVAEEAFEGDGWFMKYLVGAMVILCTAIAVAYATALLAIGKIGTALVLAVGPIFIIFLLFSATRQMFSSWLQQLFNFAFIVLLTQVLLVFVLDLYSAAINRADGEAVGLTEVAPLLIISIIIFMVLGQVSSVASGLASGAQLHTMGAGGAVGRKFNSSLGSAKEGARAKWKERGGGSGNIQRS